MNEASAREATLIQAFETAYPLPPSWSDDDRRWASRVALPDAPAAAHPPEAYIARRAHHALQRLAPREPVAAAWLGRQGWQLRWVAWAMVGAFVVGAVADSIGSSQRINLLAPPLWGLLAWNAVVYLVLLGAGLAALFRRAPVAPGGLNRLVQRLLPWGSPGSGSGAWPSFVRLWSRRSAALSGARAATLMHAGAAALALGLVAGMYARGLVLDYRAAWETTFLSASTAHAALSWLLAPAAALSGIALPDLAGFEAMRGVHGGTAAGAPAAPWIHLFALTLGWWVVLPRVALALLDGWRAHRLAQRVALPLGEPYFQNLLREQRAEVAHVQVLPYAQTPEPQAVLGLRGLLASALGGSLQLQVLGTLPFGAEDDATAWPDIPADVTLAVALFDLSATPEVEHHAVFVRQLAQRAPPGAHQVVLIDEGAFVRRFRGDAPRVDARRAAWRALLSGLHLTPVFADLAAGAGTEAASALQAALAAPRSAA